MAGLVRRMNENGKYADMNDITTPQDVQLLVNSFYDRVRQDNIIGHIFQEIIGNDWSHHLPIMYRFWETVLLDAASYSGNAVQKHIAVDKRMPLQQMHYDRWLLLWQQTIDSLFNGDVAETAKKRATTMMHLIAMKVQWSHEGKTVL